MSADTHWEGWGEGASWGEWGKEALGEPGEDEIKQRESQGEKKEKIGRAVTTKVAEVVSRKQKPGNHNAYHSRQC